MNLKRILVTGGAGFVGSALANRLAADGHAVLVLDDLSRGRAERLSEKVHAVSGDIRDPAIVAHAASTCDSVFHLAYVQGTQNFTEHPQLTIQVALKGMMNVLDACQHQGGKDLILASSSEAYQVPPDGYFPTDETVPLSVPDVTNPRAAYGGGKLACEIAALAYSEINTRTVIVRPHNIYGPDMGREHVIPEFAIRMQGLVSGERSAALQGIAAGALDFPIQGTGEETRSFCHIDDAVDGLLVLLERGEDRNVYHLGTEQEISVAALAHAVAAYHSREIDVVPGKLPQGSPPRRLPDTSKLCALGYRPKVALADGLHETLEWYGAHAQ